MEKAKPSPTLQTFVFISVFGGIFASLISIAIRGAYFGKIPTQYDWVLFILGLLGFSIATAGCVYAGAVLGLLGRTDVFWGILVFILLTNWSLSIAIGFLAICLVAYLAGMYIRQQRQFS